MKELDFGTKLEDCQWGIDAFDCFYEYDGIDNHKILKKVSLHTWTPILYNQIGIFIREEITESL